MHVSYHPSFYKSKNYQLIKIKDIAEKFGSDFIISLNL